MKRALLNAAAFTCMAPLVLLAGAASAADVTGLWAATTQIGDAPLPFKLELRQKGSSVSGHFFDGERANTPSDFGHADGDHIHLEFKSYAASFDADVKDGVLKGEFKVSGHVFPITAVRAGKASPASPAPDIGGEWIIPYSSPKGEKAWRLIVQENRHRKDGGDHSEDRRRHGNPLRLLQPGPLPAVAFRRRTPGGPQPDAGRRREPVAVADRCQRGQVAQGDPR